MNEYRPISRVNAPIPVLGSGVGPESDSYGIRQNMEILLRRRWVVIATTLVVTALMGLFLYYVPPRYTAELTAVLDAEDKGALNLGAALTGMPQDEASLLNSIEVLRSRSLAERTINALSLQNDPEFNAALRPPGDNLLGNAWRTVASFLGLPAIKASSATSELPDAAREMQLTVDAFLRRLNVQPLGRSRSVDVKFTAGDAIKAARIANALGDQYIVARLENKLDSARETSSWLSGRVAELRANVQAAEAKVEDYRKRNNLLQGDRASLIAQRISDTSAKLTEATIDRRGAEAKVAEARKLAAANRNSSIVEVLHSDTIRRFREQELELQRKEADLSSQYGPRHPMMQQIHAERESLDAKVAAEIDRIMAGLASDAAAARTREDALEADLDRLKKDLGASNEAGVGLRALERDADASRLLLERFMASFVETKAQQNVGPVMSDVQIISRASPPEKPSFPRITLMLAAALLSGCVLGVMIAFAVEAVDATYRSAEQVVDDTGLTVLSHVPRLPMVGDGSRRLITSVLKSPGSAYAESIRSIYTRLLLSAQDNRAPKTILFLSTQDSEGKTTTALSLARLQAAAGQRVIVVDVDCRRTKIAKILQLPAKQGVMDLLTHSGPLNGRDIEEATSIDQDSGARVILAGRITPNSAQLLASKRFSLLLDHLEQAYDLVILDAPPICALSDGLVLSRRADVTVAVVAWGKAHRRTVKYAFGQLFAAARHVGGVVLTKVDTKKHSSYSYGDSKYYTGGLKAYYKSSTTQS